MSHHLSRRLHHDRHFTSPIGAVILIVLGSVFLLQNFGILSADVWDSLGRLWPVFLILIGLDRIMAWNRRQSAPAGQAAPPPAPSDR